MTHLIIGTAGHVDHGKSSLILALTGRDPDRLREEKERGITIELGFTWLDHPDGRRSGIIDVPGHERFVSNMLAGAGGIDLALLVVAADEGVMPQTKEHLGILSLLGIPDGLIAVTKCDLVDDEFLELVEEDIRDQVKGTFLEQAPLIHTSTVTGQGIEALRKVLFEHSTKEIPDRDSLPFRLPVDRIFSLGGFGTIVTGTLIEGTIRTGDQVELYPQRKTARVRGIQIHETSADFASSGQRVALNLTGIKKDDLKRGDTLAAPGSLRGSFLLDAMVTALPDTRFPITNKMRVHLFHGAREILARIVLLDRDSLEAGETGPAQLRMEEELFARQGDRFVIRFFSPLETVGGGRILDPLPVRRRRWRPVNQTDFGVMEAEQAADRLALAIALGSDRLDSLETAFYRAGIKQEEARALLDTLIENDTVIRLNETVAISRQALESLGQKAASLLARFHESRPLEQGMKREELRTRLMPRSTIQLSDLIVDQLGDRGLLNLAGGLVFLPEFQVVLTAEEENAVHAMEEQFLQGGFSPPAPGELTIQTGKRVDRDQLLSLLISRGTLVRLSSQILMHTTRVDQAWELARRMIEDDGSLALADFRDRLETSRKFAMALLEYFDKLKRTRLTGEVRLFDKQGI
ncbi:MAG: selenocysteine-specific translation elongation factor [Clostridiaceae bacterium]|nr:selenocysteine-specific translation elongation factor [Clostridiaceae bacterium]